jgi:hypothetical protein
VVSHEYIGQKLPMFGCKITVLPRTRLPNIGQFFKSATWEPVDRRDFSLANGVRPMHFTSGDEAYVRLDGVKQKLKGPTDPAMDSGQDEGSEGACFNGF